MLRKHYLLAYDISDDKRRTRVFKTLLNYGDHAQFSVFFCELTRRELAELRSELLPLINAAQDQVLIVDLGPATSALREGVECLGRPYRPAPRVLVV